MGYLSQVVAVEKGVKNRVAEKLTAIYKTVQKSELFSGHHKTFTPANEDPTHPLGVSYPDDVKNVQFDVTKLLNSVRDVQTELLDVTFAKDSANCVAKADVVVDGVTLVKDAPVSYLLWLEKQMHDLHSELKESPTLDPADKWSYDSNQGMFATAPIGSTSTKKIVRPLVMAEATKEHPAQVKEITEDVRAGTWSTTKYSSALPVDRKEELLNRVDKLQTAIKQARENANRLEVPVAKDSVGKKIFDYVLAK